MSKKLFTLLSFTLPVLLFAQEIPYTFSTWNEPYQDLESPTMLTDNQPWDDPQLFIDFGFDFEMMGETFSAMIFMDPGVILFPVLEESDLNVLTPYNADIITAGYPIDTSMSSISFEVTGNPGNRICKIQWKDVAFYYEAADNDSWNNRTNFQVWFYETTNDFEYRYGDNTIKDGEFVHDFGVPMIIVSKNLNLDSGAWEALWMLNGDPANPGIINVADFNEEPTEEQLIDGEPPTGQVYHFDTGIVGVNENAITSSFNIYPTATENFIFTAFNSSQKGVMKIYDMLGNEVHAESISNGVGRTDVSGFANGPYIISIHTGDEVLTTKFIKK